ncbi:Werner Syndrome-like exonuclease [Impatiens glandulifera]|uniref:Werner Syndrome-like exonuclease n=1 Tax=Impatiens glandulifera TaxID=253017 RepID=UPI001FB14B4D|nr:Werner Syndrome-like exonuclease [Impatiens glandulifera]
MFPDWDRPFTDQEINAIDAVLSSASSSSSASAPSNNRHVEVLDDCRPVLRRRLPGSIAGLQPDVSVSRKKDDGISESKSRLVETPKSSKLLPCSKNRLYDLYNRPCQTKVTMNYPDINFKGRIIYSKTFFEVEKATLELLESCETKKNEAGVVVLGLDIEWKPTFKKGVPPGKAAVLQICADTSSCHVMHIIHSGIPHCLKSLLENPAFVKVGVGISNDAVKLFSDHNASVQPLEDLSFIANQKLVGGKTKNWSLSALTEMLICKRLAKPGKIRLGNWAANILSKKQIQYAATDAYVSWYIYQVLKNLPDPVDSEKQELPDPVDSTKQELDVVILE